MMIEAEKAESEWKQRTTQLWSGEEIKLALGEVELSTSSIIQEALGVAIHENKTEVFQTDSTSELTQTGNEIPVNEPKSSEPR